MDQVFISLHFLRKVSIILVLCFAILISSVSPAIASVKEVKEAPGQVLYKSKQSWKDQDGKAWQVVFFKRIKDNKPQEINLRLVGFPDLIEFEHPEELTIKISQDLILTAPDVFIDNSQSPSPNVGQYDFSFLANKLESSNFWLLELPVKGDKKTVIRIPYFLIQQWQEIIEK